MKKLFRITFGKKFFLVHAFLEFDILDYIKFCWCSLPLQNHSISISQSMNKTNALLYIEYVSNKTDRTAKPMI